MRVMVGVVEGTVRDLLKGPTGDNRMTRGDEETRGDSGVSWR